MSKHKKITHFHISTLIQKNFAAKLSTGGNRQENPTALRLLPLMVGKKVPGGDEARAILLNCAAGVVSVFQKGIRAD